MQRNEGLMLQARGADTCELACDAVWRWWQRLGRRHYASAPRLLLLCDCGGSNGNRQHRFKEELCRLAADLRKDLQVARYPPGCSKYNPIEHRMLCHVSRILQAVMLKTPEVARRTYAKGLKATRHFLDHNPIQYAAFLPQLNYTAPRLAPS